MRLPVSVAAFVAFLSCPVLAQSFETPEALIEAFYAPYLANEIPQDQELYFSPALNGLFADDAESTPEGEMGAIEFDPFINGQDWTLSDFAIGEPEIDSDWATIEVSFNNFDQPNLLTYDLVYEDGGWLIDDVEGGSAEISYRLSQIFEDARSN